MAILKIAKKTKKQVLMVVSGGRNPAPVVFWCYLMVVFNVFQSSNQFPPLAQ